MRYISLVLAVILTFFAILQWNDSDALLWISIYLYAAVLSLMGFYKKFVPFLLVIGALSYLVGGIFLYQGNIIMWLKLEKTLGGTKTPFIEKSREMFGLLICSAIMIFHIYMYKRKKKK